MKEPTSWELKKRLKERGYNSLGEGRYSEVFAKPHSRVCIKVCEDPDGWPEYILWAAKNGFMGGLSPKVYSFRVMRGGVYYVASMERLYKLDTNEHLDAYEHFSVILQRGRVSVHTNSYKEVLPDIKRFLDKWHDAFDGYHLDIHDGNVMYRADGTLVLTDPFSKIHKDVLPSMTHIRPKDWEKFKHAD